MTKNKKITKILIGASAALLLAAMIVTLCVAALTGEGTREPIRLFGEPIKNDLTNFIDSSVLYKLPSNVKDTDEISVIVQMNAESLLDAYESKKRDETFTEFALSDEAEAVKKKIAKEQEKLVCELDRSGVSYTLGSEYNVLLSGFEILLTAKDFESVSKTFGSQARVIVGEVYNEAETKLVNNNVNVYETGIFNSKDFKYDGTGMVVAVLDTGLDYYHSAFSVGNFTADRSKLGLTYEQVKALIDDTVASELQSGLTASDVYINEKVPFGFDYADNDSDVFPIQSDHGTHVSGIIAGNDDVITGVAPNAQLVEMKIFSDTETSSRSSWILNALEDCVVLGVDVINMSIGTACGFSRESDKEAMSGVYDRIRETGISLVVAASNSFNSTYGSEKNGNLGLTSNPDSATVGSPSTYEGALSVASISGTQTPYLLYEGKIIYFIESSDRVSEEKVFVGDLLAPGVSEQTFEYITVPGAGRSADYTGIDVTGKIVLVRRGSTTFEEKANVAQEKGALGVIIYNNVSGDIKMNVGDTTIGVCSISQDDGEMLAEAGKGTIKISRLQTSGPFMSDFSSWGPGPDLEIKPEITAHGGSILSAVPGQDYDRISGTSMACPNVAGLSALLRQYVVENFADIANDPVKVNSLVNQLMMSTADIVINKNGLPYSVRKQGAGLANLIKSASTSAYIVTYGRVDGKEMNKTKIELGDDPEKTGVYTLKFSVKNFGADALSYELSAYVMTEGVSETKTSHGETTVTEEAYILGGASVSISSVTGGGRVDGNKITVDAGKTADVTVTLKLSDSDKKYLDDSFENGMYVEGYLMLNAEEESSVDLNVPYLAFYGDWTRAPLFDLDYYETNKDELDDAIDVEDKNLPDAYATRPIGGISEDYVSYLGSYYFLQNPADTIIAADRKYISLSNQTDGINSLRFVWAGLLRNAARIEVTITEDATGEVVFETVEKDVRKSYGDGGPIYPANVDIEFSAIEENLKNNTAYTVKLKGYLDYEDGGADTNLKNEFEFPLVTDFEAPAVTDCQFYTEYDRSAKKTRLFAKVAIYDNHYSMAAQLGYVSLDTEGYVMQNFSQYLTPVFSERNSTSYVIYELTDYIYDIKNNAAHANSFSVVCYDYALNQSTYEIELPAEYTDFYFAEAETGITLSPNELYTLAPLTYPGSEWGELLEYTSSRTDVVRVVNNKLVAVAPGNAVVIARDPVSLKKAYVSVKVLAPGETGYKKYDKPVADRFTLTGYLTNKAYYFLSSDEREIGSAGDERKFSTSNYSLSMYPSESVTLRYKLDAYFPENVKVTFKSGNESIVTVDSNGKIVAISEGFATVYVNVLMDGKSTYYSNSISIEVKDPYVTSGPSISHYYGNGGLVHIPSSLAVTEIGAYAFSNYEYIPKDENDEISEEDPNATKIWYIGDDTIEEIIIPEGVEKIGAYAFAGLTKLRKITLPSTLKMIDMGAFYGCVSLETVVGIENVKFINQHAFWNCALNGTLALDSAVAIADFSFANNVEIDGVVLSSTTQSVGAYAFAGNRSIKTVTVNADIIKLGQYAFSDCSSLSAISLNASVIPAGAFDGCKELATVSLGASVNVIGEYAFRGTAVTAINLAAGNGAFVSYGDGKYLLNADGTQLVLVAPGIGGTVDLTAYPDIVTVANGAFSGNTNVTQVIIPSAKNIGNYAFAYCTKLNSVSLGALEKIGDYAFFNTKISALPSFDALTSIGKYSFAHTELVSVIIPADFTVGEKAFYECQKLESVKIGNNAVIGKDAFRLEGYNNYTNKSEKIDGKNHWYWVYTSALSSLEIGNNVKIGDGAFMGAAELEQVTLGSGAWIGNQAFYNTPCLKNISLAEVVYIGDKAFSGDVMYIFSDMNMQYPMLDSEGYYLYRYYAPIIESVDLTAATYIGEAAFEHCKQLTLVKLGEGITSVSAGAFNMCNKLSSVNLAGVKTVGDEAFAETALTAVDLSGATLIGKYAFVNAEKLEAVTFGNGSVRIEEGAFAYCDLSGIVTGMENIVFVGDYAFTYTELAEADLSNATYIGELAFAKVTLTDFDVTLGAKLEDMGDNPFAMCRLGIFSTLVTESFNGVNYPSVTYDFNISNSIRVIDGMIYRVVPKGLELISYAGNASEVKVADGTVRISAMAFAGSGVNRVILPSTLYSVGHKAFYGCDKLALVIFTSYEAPILEEEYDYTYFTSFDNIPATGDYSFTSTDGVTEIIKSGIELLPYYMWNASDLPSNVYYGANFVDYIGHINSKLVMVKPTNGKHYDSFIFAQYFGTVVDGAAAADSLTLAAITAINDIPEEITLAHKALIARARAAYDKVTTYEQRALITNYSKLTAAEKRISDLEFLANQGNGQEPAPETEKLDSAVVAIIVLSSVLAVAVAAAAVFAVLYLKGKPKKTPPDDGGEVLTEEPQDIDGQTGTAESAEDAQAVQEETAERSPSQGSEEPQEKADEEASAE